MSLEETIRAMTVHECIRIYRTARGIFVIRDTSHPKVRTRYLARSNEWIDCAEGVDFEMIEPWSPE
jgi:hypothetical protein